MKKSEGITKRNRISIRLLCSYLVIILAPAAAVLVIYLTMQGALLDIQKEKAQNLSREVAVTFNKEVEQLENVAKYITTDKNLKKYMREQGSGNASQEYYRAYKLAKAYPDYALLNRFIKNIYILPLETAYLIQVPRVVPNNHLGMSILDLPQPVAYEKMARSLFELGKNGLVYGEADGVTTKFQVVQRYDYNGDGVMAGTVVIEMQEKELKSLLAQSLAAESGMSFLVDGEGQILYVYDSQNERYQVLSDGMSWQSYLQEYGWEGEKTDVYRVSVDVDEWSIVTVMPHQELLSKVGNGRYVTLILCILSILIGVAICLWYWNDNQPLVARYLKYREKYPQRPGTESESMNIWKNFGGVLDQVDNLQMSLEKQKQRLLEGITRKILYGFYDSLQELEQELAEAEVAFPVELPCVLVSLEAEDSVGQKTELSSDELEAVIREELERRLKEPWFLVAMGSLSYIVLIHCKQTDGSNAMRRLFEELNYAVYSRIPVILYTGISGLADTALAITEEYEHAGRICEYARYYKLRMPCLLEELPRHQYVVFTVELEIQLEKTIKSGTRDRLETLITQVSENYLYLSEEKYAPASYNLEVLRCILLRCLSDQKREERQEGLMKEIHQARGFGEMEQTIWHVWQYFEDRRLLCQEQDLGHLKEEIDHYMEEGYPNPDFNLAALAGWMEVPEKKLYGDFKKIYGVSFSSYLEMKRLHYAQEFLKEKRPIGEVSQAVGYSSDYSFRRAFKRVVGMIPSDYQKMQENSES